MFFTVLSIELFKIFHRLRTYIGFSAIIVLVSLIQVGMWAQGKEYALLMMQSIKDTFIIEGNLINAYLIAFIVLNGLFVHIPFLITLVSGEVLAGESTGGTIRIYLTKPVHRGIIVLAKYVASQVYTAIIIALIAIWSLGIGSLLFGTGELMVLNSEQIVVLQANDILWRFGFAFSFAFLSMVTVASLAFFFSSLVENAIGPIVSTMAVIIVLTIISTLDVPFFKALKPYFFTTYMAVWRDFFAYDIDWAHVAKATTILALHSATLFGVTYWRFTTKDITT